MSARSWWGPAAVLAVGALLVAAGGRQHEAPLRAPLAETVPARIGGWTGRDRVIAEEERRVAGMDDYLMRIYHAPGAAEAALSVYVGYYRSQSRGRSIHSPKNCLPGAGWEVLTSGRMTVAGPRGPAEVNRALLQNEGHRVLVLYWYQGRGRVSADEYAVKWHLLRDAAIGGRTEEALVRLIVPVHGLDAESEKAAMEVAARAAGAVLPAVERALPEPG
jgi:EpsI family protein